MDARNKGYMVMLRTDQEGAIDWLFTDCPPRSAEFTLHPDQLRLFLLIKEIRGFHGLRFKGSQLFREGRLLPPLMHKICGKSLEGDRYIFHSESSEYSSAQVFLKVAGRAVKQFEAMEAQLVLITTEKGQ
jgi:hypothetical protein